MESLKLLRIDSDSRMPKYRQIVNSILEEIEKGSLKVGMRIPSINEISEEYYLSRDTVEKAYNFLKEKKIIVSAKGKGYYVARAVEASGLSVLFLMNKLSSYKLRIYNAFVGSLGSRTRVDLKVYHCDPKVFLSELEESRGAYDYYVIMPHFKDENLSHRTVTPEVLEALRTLPEEKVIYIDNMVPDLDARSAVYQDFRMDIYEALSEASNCLRCYQKLILVYPRKAVYPYPSRIRTGFQQFCADYDFQFEILDQIYADMELQSRDAYIIIEENDLVALVKQIRDRNLTMGKDIGVISYNDTPLKDLLGITVISTDFDAMGETAAYMIQSRKQEVVKNAFHFINRDSI
jgi:DNA-binding transcriptional regulator YhcF (GntR family)